MNLRITTLRKLACAFLAAPLLLSACARDRAALEASREAAKQPAESPKRPGVEWVSYVDALEGFRDADQPLVMLYFTHDECTPCEMMEKWVFTDAKVVNALKAFTAVKVKGDEEAQLTQRFNVQTFPMVIFADVQQGEIDRKTGYRDANFMVRWIGQVKRNTDTLSALTKQLESKPDDVALLVKQAHNYLDAGETEQALELAKKAEALSPADATVLALFGLCYLRLDKLSEAETSTTAALEADPKNEEAGKLKLAILLKKGEDSLTSGDYSAAIELFSAAVKANPDNFNAYIDLGQAFKENGETEKAFEQFRKAASSKPDSPVPHFALGNLYQQNSDDAMAEKEYTEAIKTEPRYDPPYFRLMELYERNDRRGDLMEMYEKVLPIEPAGAHNEIAWFMATSKHKDILDPKAAIKHANTAVELDPKPWYIDTLAEAYYADGQYGLAIAIIKEAMAKKPDDMAYYEGQLEKFQKAKEQAVADKTQTNR